MKRNNKKGFTIVELVIVIAVIAILSAVLIPTFGSIIDQANNSSRDQEARNLYTTYLAEVNFAAGETIIEDGVVRVETGKSGNDVIYHYYTLEDGNIDFEGESTTQPTKEGYTLTFTDDVVGHWVANSTSTQP